LVERGVLHADSWIVADGSAEWSELRDHAAELGLQPFDGKNWSDATVALAPRTPTAAAEAGHGSAFPAVVTLPIASNGSRFGSALLDVMLQGVTLYIGWFIWSFMIWPRGLTPAKQLIGLRVVDLQTGETATRQKMAEREVFAKFVLQSASMGLVTVVSGFMVLFDDQHRAIWDRIAKTVVVDAAIAGESSARWNGTRLMRIGWALLGLSLLTFVIGGFTGEGGEQQGPAWFILVVAAVLAVSGVALLLRGAFRRRAAGP